ADQRLLGAVCFRATSPCPHFIPRMMTVVGVGSRLGCTANILSLALSRHLPQAMVAPPSITSAWPVMKLPAFDARKTAAPAISSGRPMRRNGAVAVERSRIAGFSHRARAKSVLTKPEIGRAHV